MPRPYRLSFEYFGVVVFRNTLPGSALRYHARTPNGLRASDTQNGIKRLIRESL